MLQVSSHCPAASKQQQRRSLTACRHHTAVQQQPPMTADAVCCMCPSPPPPHAPGASKPVRTLSLLVRLPEDEHIPTFLGSVRPGEKI